MCMSIGMLLVILPVYANDELGAGSFGVALTVAAVSPMLLVFQPIAGRIGDKNGRRVLIVVGPLIAAISVAAYALVDSLEPLIALRLLTGVVRRCSSPAQRLSSPTLRPRNAEERH